MNTLSTLIYFANVLPNLSSTINNILLTFGVILAFWWYITFMHNDCCPNNKWSYQSVRKASIGWVVCLCTLMPLTSFIPSEKTFYMIAASEVGEVVVKNEETKLFLDEVKGVIMSKLKEYNTQGGKTK